MVASVEPIIEITRFADQHFKLLDTLIIRHETGIRRSMNEIGADSTRYMKRKLRTGKRSGRFYRLTGGRLHQASAPGEFPAKITGKIARNSRYSVRGTSELEVGTRARSPRGAPYPKFLEFGTKKMKRRPFIEPTSDAHASQFAVLLHKFGRVLLHKGRHTKI